MKEDKTMKKYNKLIYYEMLKELIKNKNSNSPGSPVVSAIHDGSGVMTCKVNGKSGYLEKVSLKENASRQDFDQHAEALCLRNLGKIKENHKILILIPPCIECYKKLSKTSLDVEYLLPYHIEVREREYKEYNNFGKKVSQHKVSGKDSVEKQIIINEMFNYFVDYKKNTFILRNLETNGIRNKLRKYKKMNLNFVSAINIFFGEDVFESNEQLDFWVTKGKLETWAKVMFEKEIKVKYPKGV